MSFEVDGLAADFDSRMVEDSSFFVATLEFSDSAAHCTTFNGELI